MAHSILWYRQPGIRPIVSLYFQGRINVKTQAAGFVGDTRKYLTLHRVRLPQLMEQRVKQERELSKAQQEQASLVGIEASALKAEAVIEQEFQVCEHLTSLALSKR